MRVCEIILTTGVNLIGRLKEEDDKYYYFVDVLKIISTPMPLKKDAKNIKDLTFVPTMLPFRLVGQKSDIKIRKDSDIYLSIHDVGLNKYIELYEKSLEIFNSTYVNTGLDVNNITKGAVL